MANSNNTRKSIGGRLANTSPTPTKDTMSPKLTVAAQMQAVKDIMRES